MRTTYDPEADVLYAWFAPDATAVDHTKEVAPGVMLDLDEDGNVVGIEVLSIRTRSAGRYGAVLSPAAE